MSIIIKYFEDYNPDEVKQMIFENTDDLTVALQEFCIQTNHNEDIHIISSVYQ